LHREVPQSLEAEDIVLGSLLIDPEVPDKVVGLVSPNDFYLEKNRWVYETCLELYRRREPINQVSVAEHLKARKTEKTNLLEAVGGVNYLNYLVQQVPTTVGVEYYARIIHDRALRRKVIQIGKEIEELVYQKEGKDFEEIVTGVGELVSEITAEDQLPRRVLRWRNPRKFGTRPPFYYLEIWTQEGWKDVKFDSWEKLSRWGEKGCFRDIIVKECNFVPIRPKEWEAELDRMVLEMKEEPTPLDASFEERVKSYVLEWLKLAREEEVTASDLSRLPVLKKLGKRGLFYCFKKATLIHELRREGIVVEDVVLLDIIRRMGGSGHPVRFADEVAYCWILPAAVVEEEVAVIAEEERKIKEEEERKEWEEWDI